MTRAKAGKTWGEIRLTERASGSGCVAKLGPQALAQVLRPLRRFRHGGRCSWR